MTRHHHRRENTTTPRRAFTLVEAVLVTAIIGILASIALPHYAGFVAREQVQAAARRIVTDLTLAQRQARITSASQTVVFDPVAGTYTLANLKDPDRHNLTYLVSLKDEPYRAGIVSASFGGDATIIYDGYGAPDSNGTIVIAVGGYRQTITVDNGTGRARMLAKVEVVAIQ
jgi:prepilin-type N-terminal cleavage/methylation domain-containing protein